MTQELIDLRNSILEQRYADALGIVDELEGMGRQAILRNIQSFLVRLMIHLIKNQVEQRLTNSWTNSIRGSIREIKKINLQDNKNSYYVKIDEWELILEEEFEEAIRDASDASSIFHLLRYNSQTSSADNCSSSKTFVK